MSNLDEQKIRSDLQSFCDAWKPEISSDDEILHRLFSEYIEQPGADKVARSYLKLLVDAGDSGVSRGEIYLTMWPHLSEEDAAAKLAALRNRLNVILGGLSGNRLANYQIKADPNPVEDPHFDDLLRIETLSPTSASYEDLKSSRFSSSDISNPKLRIACDSYDLGDYYQALSRFDDLLPDLQRKNLFNNSELTQFFYYLSKTLLKLNWYKSLSQFLALPYRRFSHLLQGALDAELYQVAGISYRQQLASTNALSALDHALLLLDRVTELEPTPKIWQKMGDVCVLKAQVYLDEVHCVGNDPLAQEASLMHGESWLEKAREYYQTFWDQANKAAHYEGRLYGTLAFLYVAQSKIVPNQLSLDKWAEAETYARGGFEPIQFRKPFGIVAGKYAFSIVLLAKGEWFLQRELFDEAYGCFKKGLINLLETFVDYIETDKVVLGSKFELPKVLKTMQQLSEAMGKLKDDQEKELRDKVETVLGDTGMESGMLDQVCVYTPLV